MTGILGYADDAIIVTAVLRSVVRRAGIDAVRAHWPGTDDGFTALARLTGITGPTTTQIDDADRATLGDRGPVDGLGDRGPAEAVAPISASTMIAEVVARLTIEAPNHPGRTVLTMAISERRSVTMHPSTPRCHPPRPTHKSGP